MVTLLYFFSIVFFVFLGLSLSFYYVLAIISTIQSSIGGAPYVYLEKEVAVKMWEMAKPQKGETAYDLGCGDARHLIYACKRYELNGVGIEIAWWPLIKAWVIRKIAGMEHRIVFYSGNFIKYNFKKADIVFLYLFEDLLKKLGNKFKKELKPGTRIISARYKIPNWEPDFVVNSQKYPIYLYLIK